MMADVIVFLFLAAFPATFIGVFVSILWTE